MRRQARPRAGVLGRRRAAPLFQVMALGSPRLQGAGRLPFKKRSAQRELDALTFDVAGQLVDQLLRARPEGMDLEQLLEGLQGGLLLADLAQDLA